MAKKVKTEIPSDAVDTLETVDMSLEEMEKEQESLSKEAEKLQKVLQEKEHPIDVGSKGIYKKLMKHLEHNVSWTHNEVMGLIMLHNNLKEQKALGLDENNCVHLRTANVATLYKSFLSATGSGYHEAKTHLEILTTIGESVSKGMETIEKDNQVIRDVHQKLNDLDTRITAEKEGITVSDTTPKEEEK